MRHSLWPCCNLLRTMGRLEASTTKLMWVNQQKISLGTILSSLPVQEFPHVATANPAVGHSPSFPLRDASFFLTLEPQPVCENVRKDLSKVSKIVFSSFEKPPISDKILVLNLMKY